MPCSDNGEKDFFEKLHNEGKEMMTPLLCSACKVLERLGYDFDENPLLSQWWDKHKTKDKLYKG
jgi:hypothetical protein